MAEEQDGAPAPGAAFGSLTLRFTDERMALIMDAVIAEGGEEEAERQMRARLADVGIQDDAKLTEATKNFQAAVDQSHTLSGVTILAGQPPKPPRDGEIIWAEDFFRVGFLVNEETGQINYRERAAKRAVSEGQLLATVVPPLPGEPGQDVLGRVVQPRVPRRALIRAGRNVEYVEAEHKYYAKTAGQVRYQNEGLQVDDSITIQGNVGLSTGNIHHPGSLSISGNIDSETAVEAAGDIDVFGGVGNARITSEGSLSVQGGITGGPACVIRVAGDIHAHYIRNADIEAKGNILVESEIIQCRIKTRGSVTVTQGRIVGGEIVALQGVQTDQFGSEGGGKTVVRVGVDYTLKERLGDKESVLADQKKRLEAITQRLAPFRARAGSIPPKLKDMVVGLLQEAKQLQESSQELETEIETIRAESKGLAKKEVLVRKWILPDVHFHVHPQDLWVREQLNGPLRVCLREQKIRVVRVRGEGRRLQEEGEEVQLPGITPPNS